jgi:putative nucleotidyltransferase with HDIG domain
MYQLSIICDSPAKSEDIRRPLAGMFDIHFVGLNDIQSVSPDQYTIFDIDLVDVDSQHATKVKEWLKRKPSDGKVIFIIDETSRLEAVRAHALGAADVAHRPIDGKIILSKFWGDLSSLASSQSGSPTGKIEAVNSASEALQNIFSSACLGGSLNPTMINAASEPILRHIEAEGLASWIDVVRKHHSQTYQHSLLVTGIAVAFGRHLGASQKDRERLSFAGMLHDIGKARIPVGILEKPAPLDKSELAVMREHPQFGFEVLKSMSGLHKEMIDMVVHHHEYLDGSGYPHGIRANEISDLVRMITISDIFGALIERRSYRPAISAEAAYQALLDMGPKLDKDLVREFRFASHLRFEE